MPQSAEQQEKNTTPPQSWHFGKSSSNILMYFIRLSFAIFTLL